MFSSDFPSAKLRSAASAYGTPLYLYGENIIRRQFLALSDALAAVPHKIHYAVKANFNLSILKLVHLLGGGFDIVSGGELRRVLAIGKSGSDCVYAGVGKSRDEIELALKEKIKFFNVESLGELEAIESVANSSGIKAPVSFRINPDVAVDTHPYLSTGLYDTKFGVPISEAGQLWEKIKNSKSLELVGLDCHIGSHINDVSPLHEAYTSLLKVGKDLESRGAKLRYMDFGGGFGVSFSGHYTPLDMKKYGEMVRSIAEGTSYEYIVEPGKFLVTESGILLSRVLYKKQNSGKTFVVIDAGMNDLIRPSLYEAFHEVAVVERSSSDDSKETVDIVGPVCETGCYLAKDRLLPTLSPGDLVAILDSGGYGFAMASHYNSRALPAEAMLTSAGDLVLTRKRQKIESQWADEIF